MRKISRRRRAELQRHAHRIRQNGQRDGWSIERIAVAIRSELPEIQPLEAWRLAYGWTRPQVLDGIAFLYEHGGLAAPPINSSMLCRWEHGELSPSGAYADVLCRLYRAGPEQLGLVTAATRGCVPPAGSVWYGRSHTGAIRQSNSACQFSYGSGYPTMTADNDHPAAILAAVRESIQLSLEIEGPAGGPLTREQFEHALAYYDANYSAFPPGLLAVEVHRCRALITGMLRHTQPDTIRTDLRRLAGWLSALLGNLSFHLSDYLGAWIHLGTAARLGSGAGDARLICWSLGAQSMVARYQHRYADALELARQGLEHVTTPLTHAQLLAWAELPALARLQSQSDADRALTAARRHMEADPDGEQPGRFGFDVAEFELHIAEAHLSLDDPARAATHAQASLAHTAAGRPGWAAATLALAGSEALRNRPDQAAELALGVLETIPPQVLREPARKRLTVLDGILTALDQPGAAAHDLRERLRALPPLVAPPHGPEEPGGAP
ncbi:MAG: helix-turn-helix domain-containing protein [Egibacteraceae bacterium]